MRSDEVAAAARRRLDDLDLSGVHLHGPNFEGTRITDGYFVNADISADIEGLRLNGVDVAPLVQGELDRRQPDRVKLRAIDPAGLRSAWELIEERWAETMARATQMPEALLFERVDEEWSFAETLRHLIMATDCWLKRMVSHEPTPYYPGGLAGSWLTDPAALGLDPAARPTFQEIVEVRREHMDAVKGTIAAVTPEELLRVCSPPDSPGYPRSEHSVLQCLHVILDEEWEHNCYANRDLDYLELGGA